MSKVLARVASAKFDKKAEGLARAYVIIKVVDVLAQIIDKEV